MVHPGLNTPISSLGETESLNVKRRTLGVPAGNGEVLAGNEWPIGEVSKARRSIQTLTAVVSSWCSSV
jgi:hypothetical protein